MPRLHAVAAEDYSPEQKRIADMISGQRKAPVRGPFGVLLHAPEICEMFANFVDLSLDEEKSRIPLRLKELAIITVGRVYGSDYEWFIHSKRAVDFGIDADAVEDMRHNRVPTFLNEDETLVYEVAKELAETRRLSDANFKRAFDHFGKDAMVELAALVGFYHTVSVVLNVFEVEAPEGDPHPLKG
jgi:4-carboxymuconolactone decarboxylase